MMKRIIALLLALILTVGLLPTVALAEDAPEEGGQTVASSVSTVQSGTDSDNNTDNPVHVIKTFTPGEDGEFGSLTLEAYVTNPLQVVTETTPLDIVLVLDQSGSMGYCINCGTEFNNEKWDNDQCNTTSASYQYTVVSRANADKNKTYYTPVDGKYYEAEWCNGWHLFGIIPYKDHEEGWYYYGDYGHTRVTGDLYERTKITGHKHRLDALTEALKTFVNSVEENGGDHNVAVVGFADKDRQNTELLTGVKLSTGSKSSVTARYYPQDDTVPRNGKSNPSDIEIGNALQSLKKNADGSSSAGKTNVMNAINALTAAGGTYTYSGLEIAQKILKKAKAKDTTGTRQQVVILFTDGDTNSGQENVYGLAKQMKDTGVLVYTVGLFKGADQTKGETKNKEDDNNLFLNKVSNNSKLYSANNSKPSSKTDKSYYLPAQDAASLSAVFAQISREVSLLNLTAKTDTVLKDTLSGYFTFDVGENENIADKITIQTAEIDGLNADGTLKWKTPIASSLKPTVNGKTISVNGFNYEENAITIHNADGQTPTYSGNKLIVTIPIKPDTNSDVTWQEDEKTYDTNDIDKNKAGLSNYGYKDKTEKNLSTTLPTSPKAPVTGYTVSYVVTGGDSTCPTVAAGDNNKVYIEGQTYEILNPLADTTNWKFDGWYFDDAYTRKVTDADKNKAMDKSDVTYYGKWENATATVNLASYVKKTLTGDLPTGYSESFTAQITGTGITAEGGLTITTDSFTSNDFNGTTTVTKTFKGTDATKVDLTIGTEYVYTVTEVVPSPATTGMTYGAAVKFALKATDANTIEFYTVSADDAKTKVDAAADQYVTITNAYNPTSVGLSLSECFQKHLTSNTANVPTTGKTFTLTITGTSDNITDKTAIIGTAAVGTLAANTTGTSYGGSAYFTSFKKGTADVSALNFTAAGTYIYKVQETAGSVAGMSYDTTEYTLTVVVTDNAGALEITSAIVTKPGTTDTPVEVTDLKTSFLTIENTFTAATLPLDPPTEDPESLTAGFKVIKSLTGDTKTETFRAQLLEGTTVKATASAAATTGTPVAFKDFGTLVFTEVGTKTYTIKEVNAGTAGMTYDSTEYTLTVEVVVGEGEDSDKLVIKSATYAYTDATGTVSGVDILTTPITFRNTYTKPTYAVKKSVVEDPSITVPTDVDKMGYQYPTGGKFIVEKTYTDNTITFLYVIEVSGKKDAEMTIQEQDGGKFISVDYSAETRATITLDAAQDTYTVKLTSDVNANDPIKLYAEKTFRKDTDGKFPTTATNALLVNDKDGPKENTTIIERGSTVIDFSKMVQKHLTATGNGTVSEATFYVDVVGGRRDVAIAYALPEVTISDTYRLVLMATFNSVTGNGYDETKPFEGAIPVNQAGVYIFKLTERTDAAQTSNTYDETEYLLYVNVEPKSDGSLEVTDWHIVGSDNTEFNAPGKITFHNTIDTGKDDYYPIIIPTIINKDTGMLNKTDHFAYVIGYPDGTVHPNGQITRAEVATIFFRLLRDEVRDGAFTTSNSYSDVAYGKWYNNPISTMSALGIITGYPDGTFKPNKPITRAEFAAIAARFDETQSGKSATFSDVIGHWAAKEIGIAYYNDWIKGYPDGTFKPDQNITRAEAMTVINRVLERKPESPADLLTNMNKWTDNLDTSKWYYLDVQEATNSHGYTRKTFNYELWRQMLPDPDWSRYER